MIWGVASLLLRKRGERADRYFIAWVVLIHATLFLMQFITYYADWDNPFFNLLALLFYGFLVAVPPSMHACQQVLFSSDPKDILAKNAYHFLPALVLVTINIFGFFIITYAKPGSVFQTYTEEMIFSLNFLVITFFFLLQNLYYAARGIEVWKESLDKNADYSKYMLAYILLYFFFILSIYIQQISTAGYTGWSLSLIVFLFSAAMFYLVKQLKNNTTKPVEKEKPISAHSVDKRQATEALLSDELANQILTRLQFEVETNKVYTQPDLSIAQLAKLVDTNVKYLRYVINKFYNGSFVAYINQYRIEEAKLLLKDQSQDVYTIESIGNTSGFKSKSSFYAAFKERTGMTPSQYRQKHISLTNI